MVENFYDAKILTIDDQDDDLEILNHILEKHNYSLVSAKNGVEALEILHDDKDFDAIITDRMMPMMDGISLIYRIKQSKYLANIPIIMQTAADNDDQVAEGIEAGVYWYITKPFSPNILVNIVKSALRHSKKNRKINEITEYYVKRRKMIKNGLGLLKNSLFKFNNLTEARDLAQLVSCCFKSPKRIYGACFEILTNAVEHGNLGISFEEKSRLLKEGKWEEEINFRSKLEKYKKRMVETYVERSDKKITINIKDEGKGFDWQNFKELEPVRAHNVNGRGIYLAGLEFDEIIYNQKGNEVTCVKICE